MKAFITGGAGFIGSCMAERLLLGPTNSVTVFDNFTSSPVGNLQHIKPDNRFQIIRGDLMDAPQLLESMKGHDIVYHFASNPDIAKGAQDTSLDLNQSIIGTHRVLEAIRQCGVKKLVFLSGSGVYGDTGGVPTAEDFAPLLPVSMYGAGKLGAEALIAAFSHMFGITSYIFRLCNIVGEGQTHGVAFDFIRKLRQNQKTLQILGDGKQSKPYLHVEDLLNAIFFVMAMVEDQINVYNVSTEDAVDVNWIARVVIESMQLLGVEISYTGGERGWPGDVPTLRLDTGKIRKFGWTPRYSSQEALLLSIRQMLGRMQHNEAPQEAR